MSKTVAPIPQTHTPEQIVALMKHMRMSSMATVYEECRSDDCFADLSFDEQLWLLLKGTENIRGSNKYELLRRKARLPAQVPISEVDGIIKNNGITPTRLALITSMEFIDRPNSHIIIEGGTNSGKTRLGMSFLDTAMRRGLTVHYENYDMYAGRLRDCFGQGDNYGRVLDLAVRPWRLIMLDDVFLCEPMPHEAAILKDILDKCNLLHTGLILCTHKNLEQWQERLGKDVQGLVVMRRIMDSPYLLRLKPLPLGQGPTLLTENKTRTSAKTKDGEGHE